MEQKNLEIYQRDWDVIRKDFHIDTQKILGKGSYGTVVKAQHIGSG
jgi:hypothetical protein